MSSNLKRICSFSIPFAITYATSPNNSVDNGKDRDKEPEVPVQLLPQSIPLPQNQNTSQKKSGWQRPNVKQLTEIETNSYRQFLRLHHPALSEKEVEQQVSALDLDVKFHLNTQQNLGDFLIREFDSVSDKFKIPEYSVLYNELIKSLNEFEYILDGLSDVKFYFKEWGKVLRNYVDINIDILKVLNVIRFSREELEENLKMYFGVTVDTLDALSKIEVSHRELAQFLKKDIGYLDDTCEVKLSLKEWEEILRRDLDSDIDILDELSKTNASFKEWGEFLKIDILDTLSETKFSHKQLTKILEKYVGFSDGLRNVKFSHEELEEFLREEIHLLNNSMVVPKEIHEIEEGSFERIYKGYECLLLKVAEGTISAAEAVEALNAMVQKLEDKIELLQYLYKGIGEGYRIFQDVFQNCVKIDQGVFEEITFTSLDRQRCCEHRDVISSLVMRQFYKKWEKINDSHLRYYAKFIAQAVRLKETITSHINSLENLENTSPRERR